MKGVIPKCLMELVEENYGKGKRSEILQQAGMNPSKRFLATEDTSDDEVMKLVKTTCTNLGVSLTQAADLFGDYWVNTFAPKIYSAYYRGANNAREMLLKMDQVHQMTTRNIANAHPPRFEYQWQDDKTLLMTYKSKRNLIDFLVGLIKGVGKHFNENLDVQKMSSTLVKVTFPN